MRFGKGLTKRKSPLEDVSDPGSEDSWDLLYKANKSNQSKTNVKSNQGEISKAVPELQPVSSVTHQKEVKGDQKVTETGRNVPAHPNMKPILDANRAPEKRLPLLVTSTPFVKRTQIPQFEVSEIISPLDDETLTEHSTTILEINRKNPVGSSDDAFNKLFDSRNGHCIPSSGNAGVRPLNSVKNKADTTRQYAGGAVTAMKKNQCAVLSEERSESSWETAEEKTASSSNKCSSNSETQRKGLQVTITFDKDERKVSATDNHVVPEQNLGLADALDKCNAIQDEGNLDPGSATEKSRKDPCNAVNLRTVNEGSKQGDDVEPCKEQECKKDKNMKTYVHLKKRGRPVSRSNHVNIIKPTPSSQAAGEIMPTVDKLQSLHKDQEPTNPPLQEVPETMPDCFVALTDIQRKGKKAKSANTMKERVILNAEYLEASKKDNPNISSGIDLPSNQVKPNERKTELRKGEGSVAVTIPEGIPEPNLGLANTLDKCNSIQVEVNLDPGSVTMKSLEDPSDAINLRPSNEESKQGDDDEPCTEQVCKKDKEMKNYVPLKKRGRPASSTNHVNTIQSTVSSQVNRDCEDQTDEIVCQEMNDKRTDPVSSESCPKDHSNIPKSVLNRLENLDDVSTQTDEDDGPSVPQEVTEKICSEAEKNVMFAYNSNFAVQLGKNVLLQSGQFGFELKGKKVQAVSRSKTQLVRNIRLNTITGNQENLPHEQAQITEEANVVASTKSIPSVSHSGDVEATAQGMDDHPNIDSSSEEEKKLLLAQSAQRRKNQSQSCCKLKSPNFIEHKSQASNVVSNAIAPMHNKPDTAQKESELSNHANCVPSAQSEAPVEIITDVLNSSSEPLIFVSRNPQDLLPDDENLFPDDDDDFDLEIMSSSDEESCQMGKKTKTNQTKVVKDIKNKQSHKVEEPPVPCQPLKGGNLSLKAKQIRRRREEKIQTLLQSRRGSSDSDAEVSSSCLSKKAKPGSGKHPNQRKNKPKKPAQNESNPQDEAHVTLFESEPENPHEAKGAESSRGNSRVEQRRNFDLEKHKENMPCKIKSPKTCKHSPTTSDGLLKPTNRSSYQSIEETCIPPSRDVHKIRNTERQVSSGSSVSALTTKEKGLKRTVSSDLDMGSSEVPKKMSRNTNNKKAKKRFNPCSSEKAADIEYGVRQSSRTRKAPSAYWLGRRAPNDECISNEAITSDCHANDAKQIRKPKRSPKSAKVLKRGSPVTARTVPKNSKKETKSSQILGCQSSADTGEVLQYEGDLETLSQSCKLYEVKKVECVWNNRMEGDLLYLGTGAGFTNFNRQISDAESTAFYLLEGEICYQLARDKKRFSSGSFFIIPQGGEYHIKNVGGSTAKLVKVCCKG